MIITHIDITHSHNKAQHKCQVHTPQSLSIHKQHPHAILHQLLWLHSTRSQTQSESFSTFHTFNCLCQFVVVMITKWLWSYHNNSMALLFIANQSLPANQHQPNLLHKKNQRNPGKRKTKMMAVSLVDITLISNSVNMYINNTIIIARYTSWRSFCCTRFLSSYGQIYLAIWVIEHH